MVAFRYVARRVRERFTEARHLTGEEAAAALKVGQEELALVKRQAQVYSLYASVPSIMNQPRGKRSA